MYLCVQASLRNTMKQILGDNCLNQPDLNNGVTFAIFKLSGEDSFCREKLNRYLRDSSSLC